MSKFKLGNGGFTVIPEGRYTFEIMEVQYKEDYGKLAVKLRADNGKTHVERYTVADTKGNPNDGAINAFSYLARKAMGDMDLEEIELDELVGCKFIATITHTEVERRDGDGTMVFANVTEIESIDEGNEDDLDDLL